MALPGFDIAEMVKAFGLPTTFLLWLWYQSRMSGGSKGSDMASDMQELKTEVFALRKELSDMRVVIARIETAQKYQEGNK
jgi:hypothetical protein